ncbi:MAG: tRNA (guanine-N(7)-)-methyltransferase [Myxococcota bacterium]|nr:tRNA (guanine-N(7)-)-methyltransferase [Myxococcota bacterium]
MAGRRKHVNPFHFRAHPEGIDLPAALPFPPPYEVHIGAGKGDLVLELARENPGTPFIGLEIRDFLTDGANRQAAALNLKNAVFINCNVNISLDRLFAPEQVRRFDIRFPDPWFKKRHHKRRMVNSRLVEEMARQLIPGGDIFIMTDVEPLFHEMAALLSSHPSLELAPWNAGIIAGDTHWQRHKSRTGAEIHHALFRKTVPSDQRTA